MTIRPPTNVYEPRRPPPKKKPPPRNPPPPKPPPRGKPGLTIEEQARREAQAWIDAQIAMLEEQRNIYTKEYERQARLEAERAQAFARALAAMGMPQAIQSIFSGAAGQVAGLAGGFSGEMQNVANAQAAEQANMVAGTGQEGAVRNEGVGMGDVMYGTQGYIPGRTFAESGAGFASQAAMQPAFMQELGLINAAQIRNQGVEGLADYAAKIAEVAAQKPELYQQALTRQQQRRDALKNEAYQLYQAGLITQRELARRLGLPGWKSYPNIKYGQETGPPEVDATLSKMLGVLVDSHGIPITGKNGKPIPVPRDREFTYRSANGYIYQFDENGNIVGQYGTGPQQSTGTWSVKELKDGTIIQTNSKSGEIIIIREPGKKKPKAASASVVREAKEWADLNRKGYWAYFDAPNDVMTGSEIRSALSAAGIDMEEWNAADPNQKADLAKKAGFGYSMVRNQIDKQNLFMRLIQMGLPYWQALQVMKSQFPGFRVSIRTQNPQGPQPGKDSPAISGASYSQKSDWLADLWIKAGGDPMVARTAAAIALAESGGRVDALNPNAPDYSVGLWQINYYGGLRKPRTRKFGSPEKLRKDALANARAAVAIYKSAGNSFSPWTTYTSGAYREHLDSSQQVSFDPGGGWGGSYDIANKLSTVGLSNGLKVTSEKRKRKHTSSGGVSDHWVGSKDSYAYDLSGSVRQMDAAARALMEMFGINWRGGSIVQNFYRNGYRIQILYRTNVGGNHYNHIHIGVRYQGETV